MYFIVYKIVDSTLCEVWNTLFYTTLYYKYEAVWDSYLLQNNLTEKVCRINKSHVKNKIK